MKFSQIYSKEIELLLNLKKTRDIIRPQHNFNFDKGLSASIRKRLKSQFKTFFYEILRTSFSHTFDITKQRWKKLISAYTNNKRLFFQIGKLTRKLLLLTSRIKMMSVTPRGNIKWELFWKYSVEAAHITLIASKFIQRKWLSKTLNITNQYTPTNATEIMKNPDEYNKLSTTYLLISIHTNHTYIGQSSQPYTRFKAEITAGKNSHIKTNNSANYNVKLAKFMNKIGYTNFITIPITLLPSNSLIERTRAEKYFIKILQPNLNRKIFQTRSPDCHIRKQYRPLKKWISKTQNNTCTCQPTTGYTCGPSCWLHENWLQKRKKSSLTQYFVTEKRTDKKTKYFTGFALDLLLKQFPDNTTLFIRTNKQYNDLTDKIIIEQDFNQSETVNSQYTLTQFLTQNKFTNITLTLKTTVHTNAALLKNIAQLATQPYKWQRSLRKCTQQTLFDLYYRANTIENKLTRTKTRFRLAQYIFNRFGLKNIANITCPFTYSHYTDKFTIKMILKMCLKHTHVSPIIQEGLQNTIRIIQKNRRNISNILTNNKNTNRIYECAQHKS